MAFYRALFRALSSLKLAIVVVLSLAASLATATVLESIYDTPTAQFYVYRSWWFYGILGLLGVNIIAVALSRLPWRRSHAPFLLAHLGIVILLTGSWITDKTGLDGSMRITEGDTSSSVDLSENVLYVSDETTPRMMPIEWIPPEARFRPIPLRDRGIPYDLVIDQFITHAEPDSSFLPGGKGNALKLRVSGGPMGINQDFWLWEGDPQYSLQAMGPARFSIGPDPVVKETKTTRIEFLPQKDGTIQYAAYSLRGKTLKGRLTRDHWKNSVIEPDWKTVKLTVLDWIPEARPNITYRESRMQYGTGAPQSAIHLSATEHGQSTSVWLGLGDRAIVHFGKGDVTVAYYPKQIRLPFALKLDRFTIEHYQGTRDPSSYASKVTVQPGSEGGDPFERLISMNEPLEHRGYTFYQSSYEDADPRPVTTILSVNHDPGRPWKYLGSLLIVLGTILLFVSRYRRSKQIAEAVKL